MDVKIKVKRHEVFTPLYTARQDGTDLIIAIGGRGGMKTYEVSKFGAFDSTIKNHRLAVLRDEKETIRESILNEIFSRYNTANKYGHFDGLFEQLETGIRNKENGEMVVFTKGFRASSNDKKSNLKGVSEVDTVIIEEAEDIRDPTKFNTFVDSIRTKDRLIIIILNTPDIQHWIIKRYFNLEPITLDDVRELKHVTDREIDGYWKLVPKKLKGFRCIQTSYEDNQHLPEAVSVSYRSYGDPESPQYDLHYYLTAIKGYASSGRKGQILKKVKPIKLADYLALDLKEIYGLDFGTASPAGIVGVKMDGNTLYARQLNYLPMETISIAKFFISIGMDPLSDIIIADSADPIAIGRLRRGWQVHELDEVDRTNTKLLQGFNIRNAIKGPGSVQAGLNTLIGMRLFFVEESTDLWDETNNYIYNQNKSGEFTNEPIDDFNHLIDPIRYVANGRGRFF